MNSCSRTVFKSIYRLYR